MMLSIKKFAIFISLLLIVTTGAFQDLKLRIIGGNETSIEEYPYLASVRYYDYHICGGVIIDDKFILTTNQCVRTLEQTKLTVRIGASKHDEGQEILVARVKLYPNFNIIHKEPDLAIIKLASTINFSDKIQPVNIRNKTEDDLPKGTIVEVIGWGGQTDFELPVSKTLRKINEVIISYVDCNMKYGISMISTKMLCATNNGQSFCRGDLGGPMMFNNDLVGLASWNYGCGDPEKPDVFVYIKPYYDWIQSNIIN